MPKLKKGYKKKHTLLKRPKVEKVEINPKDIPQHLLDKMPSGFKLHPSMQDLRRSMMNSIALPFIPQISPQQQQLNQLRDNNDNKERLVNDVARSLELERERKKELKQKENENKMRNQENEHNLKMQEQELKNQINDKKMQYKLEEKQRDLRYQESKLNNSNILAAAEMNYNNQLSQLNEMKIKNERLQSETKYNLLFSNSQKAEREVRNLQIQNQAMKKTLESLKGDDFLKQFQNNINEQQKLEFENQLLESMLKQQRENQRLRLEKQFQPDENAVKAINAKYDKELKAIKDETLKLDNEAENIKEIYTQIERKKQLLRDNETNKEKLIYETTRMKKFVEGVNPENIDTQITESINKQVDKQKELELNRRIKDLNDEIYKTQLDITTQKHRDEYEKSLPGLALANEIAFKAAQAERLHQQKELEQKRSEQAKLETEMEIQKFVIDTINSVSNPAEIDQVLRNKIEELHALGDTYSKMREAALKDEQLARQLQNGKIEQLNGKIVNFFARLEQDQSGINLLNDFCRRNNYDMKQIIESSDIMCKNQVYNEFKRFYKINDDI